MIIIAITVTVAPIQPTKLSYCLCFILQQITRKYLVTERTTQVPKEVVERRVWIELF